jgi:hypothetical protein
MPDVAAHEPCMAAYAFSRSARRITLRNQYPLMGGPQGWTELAYEGAWYGHSSGDFSFDAEVFAQIVANFNAQANAIPLDFDHETEMMPPPWPARGWVHDLKVEQRNGMAYLMALIEPGPEATKHIREGAYPFTSGVFNFEAVDRKSGEPIGCELVSVALCANPFIDGQAPIRLSRHVAAKGRPMSQMVNKAELISRLRKLQGDAVSAEQTSALATALAMLDQALAMDGSVEEEPKPEEAAPPAEAKPEDEDEKPMAAKPAAPAPTASLSATPAPVAAAAPPAPEAPPAEQPAADPAADASSLAQQIMDATGMDMAALVAALQSMGAMPAAAPAPLSRAHELALSAKDHSIRALSQRVEAAESEVRVYREREADAAVAVLIDSGRLLDNARETMRAIYLSSRPQFDVLTAALPEVVPVGQHAAGQAPPTQLTPAIDESDPGVKQLRRQLSNTRLTKAEQDAAIAKRIADSKQSQTRV